MKQFAVLLCLYFGVLATIGAQTNNFTEAVSNLWNHNDNWSLGHIPTAAEAVHIPANTSAVVPTDYPAEARNIVVSGNLHVEQGGKLIVETTVAGALCLSINPSGSCTNDGVISLRMAAQPFTSGIGSTGNLSNGPTGHIAISDCLTGFNNQGTAVNAGTVDIADCSTGLVNSSTASFTNSAGATIKVVDGILYTAMTLGGVFDNQGAIQLKAGLAYPAVSLTGSLINAAGASLTASGGQYCLDGNGGQCQNYGAITSTHGGQLRIRNGGHLFNYASGLISIKKATNINQETGVYLKDPGSRLDNYGPISVETSLHKGFQVLAGAECKNYPGASVTVSGESIQPGLYLEDGWFTNEGGVVTLNLAHTALRLNHAAAAFTHTACGILNLNGGKLDILQGSLANHAIIWFRDPNALHQNAGSFTNVGIIGDRYATLDGVPIDNQKVIVDPLDPPVVAGQPTPNALTLGSLNGISGITWRLSRNGPVAGTYNSTLNNFTPNNAAIGDDQLHVRMTMSGCPAKWFVAPVPGGVLPAPPPPPPAGTADWVRQHPFEYLDQLWDIDFNDAGNGIAIAQTGRYWLSSDYGETWTLAPGPIPGPNPSRIQFAPEPGSQTAFLLTGTNIYKTEDAGATWTALANLGASMIEVISVNEIFIAAPTQLRHSTDGGQSWTTLPSPSAENIYSMHFRNSTLGWIGGQNGGIYRSTDGGQSWQVMDTVQFDTQVFLRFYDDNTGYAGIQRQLAKSTDGGQTWTVMNANAFGSHINDMAIAGPNHLVCSQGNRTFFTTDGGVTTTLRRPTPWADTNRGIAIDKDGNIWVASSYTTIARSTDGGDTYTDRIPGNKNRLRSVDFTDADHGWAAGLNFSILRTTNGGQTWQDLSLNKPAWSNVNKAVARSADELWVCGNNFLLRTTDAGQSWDSLPQVAANGNINDLVLAGDAVYTSHVNGRVYKSTDNGQSWTFGEVQPGTTLYDLSFPSPDTGYVIGREGLIARTTNGGLNWTVLPFPTTDNLNAVFFLDNLTGWVSFDKFSNQIFHTADGGQTWSPLTVPNNSFWNVIHFITPEKGYLAGGSSGFGFVLATEDGGQTWELIHDTNLILYDFDLVRMPTQLRMWVSGIGGVIDHGTEENSSSLFEGMATIPLGVYPNPGNGVFWLSEPQEGELTVFNAMGRAVAQYSGPIDRLELHAQPEGVYWLRLFTPDNRVFSGKIMLHH